MWIINIVPTTTAFTCFNTEQKKTLIICGLTLQKQFYKKTIFNKPERLLILCHSFSLDNCECLKYHQLQ